MEKVISKLKELEERQIEVKHQYEKCPDHYTAMDEKNRLDKTLTILNAKIDVLRELLNGVVLA